MTETISKSYLPKKRHSHFSRPRRCHSGNERRHHHIFKQCELRQKLMGLKNKTYMLVTKP
jgi:hypothetical protein